MYLICYLFIFRLCSIYRVGFSLLLRVHILLRDIQGGMTNVASKVFWSQKTPGGDSDESPPFA